MVMFRVWLVTVRKDSHGAICCHAYPAKVYDPITVVFVAEWPLKAVVA